MHTTVKFARSEGFALAAAMESVRQLSGHTPVLREIPEAGYYGPRCRLVAIIESGPSLPGESPFTAEVVTDLEEGWVRVFPPDWFSNKEFRRGKLTLEHLRDHGFAQFVEVKVETLQRVPLAEIGWEELPDNLCSEVSEADFGVTVS